MELISMTDFVLDQLGNEDKGGHMNYHDSLKVLNYAKLLKQPLKLEMFVPCDEEGNVLEKPIPPKYFDPTEPVPEEVEQEFYDYDKAKEKVLFEGFEIFDDMYHSTKRRFVRNKSKILISVYNRFQYHDGKIKETNPLFINHKDIEDLIKYDLTLTPSAIKLLNL